MVPEDDPNLDTLERATEEHPANPDAYYQLGRELERLDFFDRAEAAYRGAVSLAPDVSVLHECLGRILLKLDRADEAEQSLRQATALDPRNLEAHGNLAAALARQARYYEAENEFREVLALDPIDSVAREAVEAVVAQQSATASDPMATVNIAGSLSRQGHVVEAERMFRAALHEAPNDARLWLLLGTALIRQDRDVEAQPALERALELDPNEGRAEMNLGLTLRAQQRYGEAETHLRRAVELRPEDPQAYLNLGVNLWDLGRPEDAEPILRRALELDEGRVLMASSRAQAYLRIADARTDRFWRWGDVGDARVAAEASTAAAQLSGLDPAMRIEALFRAGQSEDMLWRGERDPAARERAVTWYQQAADTNFDADSLSPDVRGRLGSALRELYLAKRRRADLDRAVAALEAAVGALPADERSAAARGNLSAALDDVYRLDHDVIALQRAVDMAHSALDATAPDDPVRTLRAGNLVGLLIVQYRLDGNVRHLDDAIRLARETVVDSSRATPKNLSDFAGALLLRHGRLGRRTDLSDAVNALELAFAHTGPEDPRGQVVVSHNLVGALMRLGGQTDDVALLERAGELAGKAVNETPIDDPWRANRLGQRAAALMELDLIRGDGRLEEAIDTLEAAVTAAGTLPATMRGALFARLAAAYRRRWERTTRPKDLDAAIEAQDKAISELPSAAPERPDYLDELGTLRLAKFGASTDERYLDAAIDAWEAAWEYLDSEFSTLPVTFKLGSLRAHESVPDQLIHAHVRAAETGKSEKHLRRAWEVAEAAKARVLSDLIRHGDTPPPPDVPAALIETEQRLLDELTQLNAAALAQEISGLEDVDGSTHDPGMDLARIQTDLGRIWDAIEAHSPSGRGYVSLRRPRSVTWADVDNLLRHTPVPTGLLTVRINDHGTTLMAALPELSAPRVISCDHSADKWNYTLQRFGEELALSGGDSSLPETWHLDIVEILEPLVDDLLRVAHIVVLPTAQATLIPWPVVWQRILAKRGLRRTADVSIAPSAGFLLRPAVDHRDPMGKALVVGDPTGDLPHARSEAARVSEHLDVLPLSESATRRAVLDAMPDAPIVHLAAHAYFARASPLGSGIVLADAALTGRDVLTLRLTAWLVVLSACESGLAAHLRGDELVGLAQSFLGAGARSLVVSLWRVDDAATAELMRIFYDALLDGARPATALTLAAEGMRNSPREHAYRWGAFTYIAGAFDAL
jgi:tetratricopeptide (TPR) repeat protein